jgi:hypothetical protein
LNLDRDPASRRRAGKPSQLRRLSTPGPTPAFQQRAKLNDMLALKAKMEAHRKAMEPLAEDAEGLGQRYGV